MPKESERKHCTMCGKEFDDLDTMENFGIHAGFTCLSVHDFDSMDMDLCCSCFEKVMDDLLPKCRLFPFAHSETVRMFDKADEVKLWDILAHLGYEKMMRINNRVRGADTPAESLKFLELAERELLAENLRLPPLDAPESKTDQETLKEQVEEEMLDERDYPLDTYGKIQLGLKGFPGVHSCYERGGGFIIISHNPSDEHEQLDELHVHYEYDPIIVIADKDLAAREKIWIDWVLDEIRRLTEREVTLVLAKEYREEVKF